MNIIMWKISTILRFDDFVEELGMYQLRCHCTPSVYVKNNILNNNLIIII